MQPSLQKYGRFGLACILALLHAASPAQSPATPPTSTAASLHQERARIDARLKTAETACYQRFAVEDCLRAARHQARQAKDALRERQNRLDAQERHQRAEQRLRTIQERQRNHAPTGAILSTAKAAKAARQDLARHPPHRAAPDPVVISAQRQVRQREAAQQAARAQQQQRDKQAVAQAHRQQVQREQAERAQSGKPAAEPLPAPQ